MQRGYERSAACGGSGVGLGVRRRRSREHRGNPRWREQMRDGERWRLLVLGNICHASRTAES